MRQPYPAIDASRSGMLQVSALHTLYWEESGNKEGEPILFLHGGPGSGTQPSHRTFFDPHFYRIILFDQRGSGQSTPHACLDENTTWDLVKDIEQLREFLQIDRWVLFGGSWGSTLALVYAISHPSRVSGLILRGIFLGRSSDFSWFYQKGAHHLFPDQWERFLEPIPQDERGDLIGAYYKRLTDSDTTIRKNAAKAWSGWEGAALRLHFDPKLFDFFTQDHVSDAIARIECHYFRNKIFFPTDDWILEHIQTIRAIPGIIIHGRYDIVCPFDNAWSLHKAWPEAKLEIIPDAGHASGEPGIMDALIRATDSFVRNR